MAWKNLSAEIEEEFSEFLSGNETEFGYVVRESDRDRYLQTRPAGFQEDVAGILGSRPAWTTKTIAEALKYPYNATVAKWIGISVREAGGWRKKLERVRPSEIAIVYRQKPGQKMFDTVLIEVASTRTKWTMSELCAALSFPNTRKTRGSLGIRLKRMGWRTHRKNSGVHTYESTPKPEKPAEVVRKLLASGLSQAIVSRATGKDRAYVSRIARRYSCSTSQTTSEKSPSSITATSP